MTFHLQAAGLACERDWRLLFEQLDFELGAGDMLQISGPNGSGKTSLLRLLAGLMQPTAGQILLGGKPLAEQRHAMASLLLWIGHAAGIKDLLTAEENLTWLCALHQPASRDAIWAALAAVGLRGFEDVPCHTLSAGQQRRVALCPLASPARPPHVRGLPGNPRPAACRFPLRVRARAALARVRVAWEGANSIPEPPNSAFEEELRDGNAFLFKEIHDESIELIISRTLPI